MKKLLLFSLLLCAAALSAQEVTTEAPAKQSKGHVFLGGTGSISYTGTFNYSMMPVVGYEFSDRWAIGTGVGLSLVADGGYAGIMGLVDPFVRFTAWHNDLVYIDLHSATALGFTDELVLLQLGIRPCLRFRLTEHCDLSAEVGLFGANCVYGEWSPSIGITGGSAGISVMYRF